MRNLLTDYKGICHEEHGNMYQICWKYIESLNNVQEELGFTLANKLKKKHVEWTKHKMKCKHSCSNTLSASVATAIDFL